jgi:hypothetical protein
MSMHGNMVDAALSELPKLKDEAGNTYRKFVYEMIGAAAHEAIGGTCWPVEVEVALHKLQLAADAIIDADPVLREIFDVSDRRRAEWYAAHETPEARIALRAAEDAGATS